APGPAALEVVLPGCGAGRGGVISRDRGGLGHHRGRSPALDRLQPDAGVGGGEPGRSGVRLEHVRRAAGGVRRDRVLLRRGSGAAIGALALGGRGRARGGGAAPGGGRTLRTPAGVNALVSEGVAGALLLAVAAYSTAGGTDYGAGIWDLLAGRFRHTAQV